MDEKLARRDLLRMGLAGPLLGGLGAAPQEPPPRPTRPFLTPPQKFRDVSRGTPNPKTLKGEALVQARLTPETWQLEISADEKSQVQRPLVLDYAALLKLGETRPVRYFKAQQCNLIAFPLGQGLWEGVALRDVLGLCGTLGDVRRLSYWGFHNHDPKQVFRSSLALNQVLDAPPGDLPPILAYRLNGAPIAVERGGPVRMIVPWAHGFKSIKWLQKIVLSNRYDADDTYAEKNNDPESYLKTAAYFDSAKDETQGPAVRVRGVAMVGWPGLERIEYWLRPATAPKKELPPGDPAWREATWSPVVIEGFPTDWKDQLPGGVLPKDLWGFGPDGKPKEWPLRFSLAHWRLDLDGVPPGTYELRVRTIDRNGFAQPEPRPNPQSGDNAVPCKILTVTP